jgi:hypothetical protein
MHQSGRLILGTQLLALMMLITTGLTTTIFCSRILINAGIKKVIALTFYPQMEAIELLQEGGIDVYVVEGDTIPPIFVEA